MNRELEIISRTRGEVKNANQMTGENIFLAWGYPTAIVMLLEFAALLMWNEDWCVWIWAGIPLIGAPLMIYFLNQDYERTHRFTIDQNVILMMWIFIGVVSCVCGAVSGFAGVFQSIFFPFQGIICGMGCFMTGIILHFKPKTICGIIATAISNVSFFFQGEMWHWQLLITAIAIVIALIIPGHLYKKYVKLSRNNQ